MSSISQNQNLFKFKRVVLDCPGENHQDSYDVAWSPQRCEYLVNALDQGWHAWVSPADVPFPTGRNIAIEAIRQHDAA